MSLWLFITADLVYFGDGQKIRNADFLAWLKQATRNAFDAALRSRGSRWHPHAVTFFDLMWVSWILHRHSTKRSVLNFWPKILQSVSRLQLDAVVLTLVAVARLGVPSWHNLVMCAFSLIKCWNVKHDAYDASRLSQLIYVTTFDDVIDTQLQCRQLLKLSGFDLSAVSNAINAYRSLRTLCCSGWGFASSRNATAAASCHSNVRYVVNL